MKKLNGTALNIAPPETFRNNNHFKRVILRNKVLSKGEYSYIKNRAIEGEIFFGDNGQSIWLGGNTTDKIPMLISPYKLIKSNDGSTVVITKEASNGIVSAKTSELFGRLDEASKTIYVNNAESLVGITTPIFDCKQHVPLTTPSGTLSHITCKLLKASKMSSIISGNNNFIATYEFYINGTLTANLNQGTYTNIQIPNTFSVGDVITISCKAVDSKGNKSRAFSQNIKLHDNLSNVHRTSNIELSFKELNYSNKEIVFEFNRMQLHDDVTDSMQYISNINLKNSVNFFEEGLSESKENFSYVITQISDTVFKLVIKIESELFSAEYSVFKPNILFMELASSYLFEENWYTENFYYYGEF